MNQIVIDFVNKVSERAKRSGDQDEVFESIREELADVVSLYAGSLTDSQLIERAWKLIIKLESIEKSRTTGHAYERASTNVVVASSRIRRTHYAAYMAGKLSTSEEVGERFKCWMHNAAAHGAITFAETIDDIVLSKRRKGSADELEILKVFRNGAFDDAARFIDLSAGFDRSSCLTAYNRAKLDVLSKEKSLRTDGINRLSSIDPPEQDCDATEISWHKNNFDMFCNGDLKVREVIQREDADKLPLIEHTLKRNCDAAVRIEGERGNIWKNHSKKNTTAMAILSAGMAITSVPVLADPEMRDSVMQLLSMGSDYLFALIESGSEPEHIQLASYLGDGGLAVQDAIGLDKIGNHSNTYQMIRATFGDGGLA